MESIILVTMAAMAISGILMLKLKTKPEPIEYEELAIFRHQADL